MGVILTLAGAIGCRAGGPSEGAPGAASDGPPDARLRDARTPPARRDPNVLGRAGPVVLDIGAFAVALDEARILEQWRTGQSPPAEALRDPRLRRRLMTQALETRVVRLEARQRGLAPDPERFEQMMRLAAAGHRLETPPSPEVLASVQALEAVDPALEARFGASAERVRRVGLDVLEAEMLADALLSAVPESASKAAWLADNTRVVVDVVRVPRVPTSSEIDRAIESRGPAIAEYFASHQRLFRTPERAFVRRLLVPVPADADPAARAEARRRAEALRAEVVAAEAQDAGAFEAVIEREAPAREARSGGRMRVGRSQMPEAFEAPLPGEGPGPLSPVVATADGWHFYRVEGRAPAVERTLDDPRVKREIAAELLREADALTAAKRTAGRVRTLLGQSPDGEALAALVKSERLRRSTTAPFAASGPEVVPGVGLAPELFEAIFALTPEAPVTPVMTVRQHYVVARLVSREAPDPAQWSAVGARYTAEWKARRRPRVIDEWLTERLDGRPTWIDGPRLQGLTLEQMGFGEAGAPSGGADGGR